MHPSELVPSLVNGDSGRPVIELDSDPSSNTETNEGRILATSVGLRFVDVVAFEKWQRVGARLQRIVDSSAWCLGDWISYGEAQYSDRYRHAVEVAGLDYQTLRNYAWVARRFDLSRRRDMLSFQHHAEVAALPAGEQDVWLDRAEQGKWSRNQLRRELRSSRRAVDDSPEQSVLPRVRATHERLERWRAAAELSSGTFENWVIEALDNAASGVLEQTD